MKPLCAMLGTLVLVTFACILGDYICRSYRQREQASIDNAVGEVPDFPDSRPTAAQEVARQAEVAAMEKPDHDIGQASRSRYPSIGFCYRCGRTWNVIWGTGDSPMQAGKQPEPGHNDSHTIVYERDKCGEQIEGCFPTCEECWQQSNLEERLKYARMLCQLWRIDQKYQPADWPQDDIDQKQALIEGEIYREWFAMIDARRFRSAEIGD